ncbi:MAG: S8 family serine peptidase, partial [Planctomycetota bacterium]
MPRTWKLFAVLAATIGLFGDAWAAPPGGGAPFRAGEVVVAGAPTELPEDVEVIKHLPHANLTVVGVDSGREWGLIQQLRASGRRAGLNYLAKASAIPNDALYPFQWHFQSVQAEAAWGLSTGSGVTVAVLDTGLRMGGPDGIGCVVPGWDVVNADSEPSDGDGHGTHVSGTIAQYTNNSTGVAGLAYDACVMPVKVLDDTGNGNFADIADGIYYAVDNGAQVINMSLGTDARFRIRRDPIMDPALEYAHSNGVTVVCAAGNDGFKRNVSYPAISATTIAVGATDLGNTVTRYSNRGQGLDLVAPGGDVTADLNGDGYADGVLQETYSGESW